MAKNTTKQNKDITSAWKNFAKDQEITQSFEEIEEAMVTGCQFISSFGDNLISDNVDWHGTLFGHDLNFTAGEDGGMTIVPPYNFEL